MITPEHKVRTWQIIRQKYPVLIAQNPVIFWLINEDIHDWFDGFSDMVNLKIAAYYGYVEGFAMRHREQRHHAAGFSACIYVHVLRYGREYEDIIRLIALDHLNVDWPGKWLEMYDYNAQLWNKIMGY